MFVSSRYFNVCLLSSSLFIILLFHYLKYSFLSIARNFMVGRGRGRGSVVIGSDRVTRTHIRREPLESPEL